MHEQRLMGRVLLFAAATIAMLPAPAASQVCSSVLTTNYTEDFAATSTMDASSTVSGWGSGAISLPAQALTPEDATGNLGLRVVSVATGNFDNDAAGLDDIVAFVYLVNQPDTGGARRPVSVGSLCGLVFLRNEGGSGGSHLGFEPAVALLDIDGNVLAPDKCGPGVDEGVMLRAGDFDGDGMVDLVFARAEKLHEKGKVPKDANDDRSIYIWRNCPNAGVASAGSGNCTALSRSPGDTPTFSRIQHTLQDYPDSPRWHWASDAIALAQWNDDPGIDRTDLLVSDSDGKNSEQRVWLFHACETADSGNCKKSEDFGNAYGFGWSKHTQAAVPNRMKLLGDSVGFTGTVGYNGGHRVPMPDAGCPPAYVRGITAVIPADFDADGDTDLMLGSMSEHDLRYFENTGTNTAPSFASASPVVIPFDKGGVAYGRPFDYDLDGFPDVAVAADAAGCGGGDGKLWVLRNKGIGAGAGAGTFPYAPIALADIGDDVDWLVTLDADGDGNKDIMFGQGVGDSPYYIGFPQSGTVNYPNGVATSIAVVDTLVETTDTIINVKLNSVTFAAAIPAAAEFHVYVSNNDAQTWEVLSVDELPGNLGGTGPAVHEFTSYGAKLRWKLELHHVESLTGALARYSPGTTNDLTINTVDLTYEAIQGQLRFTRSGLAYGALDIAGTNHEFLYSASTLFPGFGARVKALDITGCSQFTAADHRVDNDICLGSGWDTDITIQGQASRNFFTASPGGVAPAIPIDTPLDATEKSILAATTDAEFAFVRDGFDDGKKLRDVGHSTPVFVGPPGGQRGADGVTPVSLSFFDPDGSLNYLGFVTGPVKDRVPMVYIGANDGTLHAIRAADGVEEWAFVPRNLAARIVSQRGPGGTYDHDYYVDGPVVVRDVFDVGTGAWRTILIAGQARGTGADDENYYFALDVTNPASPNAVPLWEFSDKWDRNGGACDGDSCDWTCTASCPAITCDDTCAVVRTSLKQDAGSGQNFIEIQDADFGSFPATGVVEIEPGDPTETEMYYYTKTAPNRLNVVNASGAAQTLNATHNSGDDVRLWPETIAREKNNQVVMEAENYQDEQRLAAHDWHVDTAAAGFEGDGYIVAAPTGTNCNDDWVTCGATTRYSFVVDNPREWDVYFNINYPDGSSNSLHWGIDGTHEQRHREGGVTDGTWGLISSRIDSAGNNNPSSVKVKIDRGGLHTFNLWMRESDARVDKIIMVPADDPAPVATAAETCENECVPQSCAQTCTLSCLGDPANEDWPECGAGNKCCGVTGFPDMHFCAPTGDPCNTPETVLGETWSPPAVGKFKVAGVDRWLVVFGSGYNSRKHFNAGRSIYFVDAITGALVARYDLDDIAYNVTTNPSTIDNTVPGGVALVDMDVCGGTSASGCGTVDRVYVGDLEGRLWKIDTTDNGSLGGDSLVSHGDWPTCVVFDAGDEDGDGNRAWAPIITKPAVAMLASNTANIYFGTGGDDRADASLLYRFYSVRDDDISGAGACAIPTKTVADLGSSEQEWIIGDGKYNDGDPVSAGTPLGAVVPPLPPVAGEYEGKVGQRYWSDPVIINGVLIAFASLAGKIESVDLCSDITGTSTVYLYALTRFRDQTGTTYQAGERYGTAITTLGKVRQAAIARGGGEGLGYNVYGASGISRNIPARAAAKTQAYVQTAGDANAPTGQPAVQEILGAAIGDPEGGGGYNPQKRFRILRWREIPL